MIHSHSLNHITGYSVEQTIREGKRLAEPLQRNQLAGSWNYLRAVELAKDYRRPGSYAVVRPIYWDGCVGSGF